MEQSPQRRFEAAERHEAAAVSHERAAQHWADHGDHERAALQRDLAQHERRGAELERLWAALIARQAAAPR
jgi:hypothetical protein